MIKISFVFGTRPEFIKINEIVNKFKNNKKFNITVLSSNQQRKLIDKYSNNYFIDKNLKLNNFKNDSIFISKLLHKLNSIYKKDSIDYLFIQGDTNTAYATSLFGYFKKIPVIHLEAGLRTFDVYNPFPEEFFRQSISKMAKIHLAQNMSSKKNLENEGIRKNIFVIGNPGIDHFINNLKKIKNKKTIRKSILITMHRRESLNSNLEVFSNNLKLFLNKNPEYSVNWPLHSNPNILDQINLSFKSFKGDQITFLNPLSYLEFLKLLISSEFIITDSGGVQEEAAYLGKPLLIARDKTERIDIIKLKIGKIINGDGSKLEQKINYFTKNKISITNTHKWRYNQGLGKSSKKVYEVLNKYLPILEKE